MGSAREQPQAVCLKYKKIILSEEETASGSGWGFLSRGLFAPCAGLSERQDDAGRFLF